MYERNENDITEIDVWIQNQKFLPKDLSENFIYTFLLGCEGDKDKTKKVLANYFFARQSIPEFFTGRDPLSREITSAWKSSCFIPLKSKQNGCHVFLGIVLTNENFQFINLIKQMYMCYDLLITTNEWGNGERILIISYEKLKHHNMMSFSTYLTRKAVECQRENFLPGKLRAVHNILVPSFLKKFHDRCIIEESPNEDSEITFHKNVKSLHKYVNPKILPSELGGISGPLKLLAGDFYEKLKAYRNFFVQEEEKRFRETKVRTKDG